MRRHYSFHELRALIPKIEKRIEDVEAERPNVRPVGPLTEDEASEMLGDLVELAMTRPLTNDECFLHGQLLAVYRQGVLATAMKLKGRFFVIPEAQIERLANEEENDRAGDPGRQGTG